MKGQKGQLEMGVSSTGPLGKESGTDMLGAAGFEAGLVDALDSPSGSRELGRDEEFNRAKNGHGHPEGHGSCDHGSNDHLASIYERQRDQFATVVPFIKQGLEQGERCLYVADDNTEEEVLKALQDGGVDVGSALDSGALSIHTKSETYLRGGKFETGSMLEFWQEALAKAKGEDGCSGVRAAAEMTWALSEGALNEERGLGQLVEYEALLNNLYSGDDYVVLCQYSRERFPEEVLSEVIRSHPFVVYNGTVCENLHYHPPEEFFEAERPPLNVSRTVEGLLSRARVQKTLQKRERFQHALYKITSDPKRSFEEKVQALFDLGRERFGMELGCLACIDPETDLFEIERTSGPHEHFVPGTRVDLSKTYCRLVTGEEEVVGVSDPDKSGLEELKVYKEFGLRSYLGTRLEIDGGLDRTFFFVSSEPREKPFSKAEKTFHHLMGQWVEQELRRKRREEDLRELNQTLEARVEKRTRQVRRLTAKVTLAEQRERDRIARLLHDGLQQRLYGSQLKISSLLEEALGEGQKELAGRLQKVEGEIEKITRALRQLSVGMSPPVLEGDGLKGALEWLQSYMRDAYELEVALKAEREFRVKEEMRVLLFRATKELLATLAERSETSKRPETSKSPEASQASIELREEKGNLVIEVVGEGEGSDLETLESHEGDSLKSACERLRLFDGELKLNASSEEETCAEIRVPIEGRLPEGESPKRMPLEGGEKSLSEPIGGRVGENGEPLENG